ncbi:hypothetical protein HDV57DRAFT_440806 [Trichoderma longibrachiatum]
MPACCLLPVAPSGIRSSISSSCPRSGLDAERMTRGGSLRHWALPNVMQGTAVGAPRQTPQFHLFSSISVPQALVDGVVLRYLYRLNPLAARGNANCSPPTNIQPDEQPQATRREPPPHQIMAFVIIQHMHHKQTQILIRIQPRRQCRPLICPACRGYVVCVSTHCQHDRMMGDPHYIWSSHAACTIY